MSCLNLPVIVVINIVNKFRFEVLHRIKFLQVEQFILEMAKEVLHNRVTDNTIEWE